MNNDDRDDNYHIDYLTPEGAGVDPADLVGGGGDDKLTRDRAVVTGMFDGMIQGARTALTEPPETKIGY